MVNIAAVRGLGGKARRNDPAYDDRRQDHQLQQRPVLGAVISALLGAAGLRLWEGLLAHRHRRGGAASEIAQDSEGVGRDGAPRQGDEEGGGGGEEAAVAQQQSKIQALEDQLAVRRARL